MLSTFRWNKNNYYDKFDLVPRGMMEHLHLESFEITNWHLFQLQDDSRSKSVGQRGPESDRAFCNRVLKELGNKQHILVINDEAHHAYRPAPLPEEVRNQLDRTRLQSWTGRRSQQQDVGSGLSIIIGSLGGGRLLCARIQDG